MGPVGADKVAGGWGTEEVSKSGDVGSLDRGNYETGF